MNILEITGSFITLIAFIIVVAFATIAILADKGMIKDEYLDYIFDDEEEEIEILD